MRLTLVQVLMNSKGYSMNPLQSLYYVSPACLVSLLLPFGEGHWRQQRFSLLFIADVPVYATWNLGNTQHDLD